MVHIPPEIKALVVDEIWYSRDPEPSLSALGLVWKDATPFIHTHRFNDVHVSEAGLPRLLAIKEHSIQHFTLIHKLTVNTQQRGAETVILSAINVEALTYTPKYCLQEISSLSTHANLTSLTLSFGCMRSTGLMDLLQTIPRLTSLTLSHFGLYDFYLDAQDIWPYEYDEDKYEEDEHFFLDRCEPLEWEAYKFPDADPLPTISHLSLDISQAEHLWFLDFICSPKSPFRDLRHLGVSDTTGSFIDARVNTLLKKYSSSLVEFELRAVEDSHWMPEDVFPPMRLTLPASIQNYTFFVDAEEETQLLHPSIFYDNIKTSCGTLKHVTMRAHLQIGKPNWAVSNTNKELDRVLVSLDLKRFDVRVNLQSQASAVEHPDEYVREQVAHIYPLITEKFLEGGSGEIFWSYKGLNGACA